MVSNFNNKDILPEYRLQIVKKTAVSESFSGNKEKVIVSKSLIDSWLYLHDIISVQAATSHLVFPLGRPHFLIT